MYDRVVYNKFAKDSVLNIFGRTGSLLLGIKKVCVLKTVACFALTTYITLLGCVFAYDLKYLQPENIVLPVLAALPTITAGARNLDRTFKINKMANEVYCDSPKTIDENLKSKDIVLEAGAKIANSYFQIEERFEKNAAVNFKNYSAAKYLEHEDNEHEVYCNEVVKSLGKAYYQENSL